MSTTTIPTADTVWGHLDAELGERESRKLAPNTYARRSGGAFSPVIVRLHSTDIVTAYVDGSVRLNTGGWLTVTTKERINRWLPRGVRLYAERGTWKVSLYAEAVISNYYDGMVIAADGSMVTPADLTTGDRDREVKKAIKGYVDLYTDDEIARLLAEAQERGTAGDCLFCQMTTEGEPLGDAVGDTDHLRLHVEEGYTMITLARNAVAARGYRDPVFILSVAPDSVRQAIRRYLTQRLATNTSGATPTGENYSANHAYFR